jgi:hypothetical protein
LPTGVDEKNRHRWKEGRMRPEARCSHPGCERPATEVAVVESAWEDATTGSALMVCSDHADRYVRPPIAGGTDDAVLRAHRRSSAR